MLVHIYAFYTAEAENRKYFYVGRSVDVTRRMREHQYSKRKGHEDKYEWIRELEAAGTPWFSEVIESVPTDKYFPDAEKWQVIRLTREGHDLKNMRQGSAERRNELAEQVKAPHIRSIIGVTADRICRKFQASKRLRRKIWKRELKTVGFLDVPSCFRMLPEVFQRKLIARQEINRTGSAFAKGLPVSDFIQVLREPLSKTRSFRLFVDSIPMWPSTSEESGPTTHI